jgi:tripartite-type tricarboxylate transporter receptor subunit TctC
VRSLALTLCLFSVVACDERSSDRDGPAEFPTEAIRVVVPFSPGGGSDTFARAIQAAISEKDLLPHGFVIDNQPGTGGTTGSRKVKDSEPDGYRILFLHDAIVTAKYAKQANYGPEAFAPIAATGELGAVIAVGPDSEFKTLGDLMAAAAEQPESISFAANLGAPSHFWARLLEDASPQRAAKFRFVQSGGGALRFGDLKGGHIAVSAFSVAEYLQFRSEGLRALAFLGEQRDPSLTEVPTAIEQGFDVVAGNLQSWWAPLGTPPQRIAVIESALQQAMQAESLRERMAALQIAPTFHDSKSLKTEIVRRETIARQVEVRNLPSQPNIPKWTLIVVVVLTVWSVLGRIRDRRKTGKTAQTLASKPRQLADFPWQAFALLSMVAVIIALWQLGSYGFRAMAVLVVMATGFQLREKVSGLDLLILLIGGCALAFGSHWLFGEILKVDLNR